jgi:hypothetical protein
MTIVYAYGGKHEALTYEQARDGAIAFRDEDAEHSVEGICRVSEDAFELVGFGVDVDGNEFQDDSTYVTFADGIRLLKEGLVYPMVAGSASDFDDPETVARLTREQFGDI